MKTILIVMVASFLFQNIRAQNTQTVRGMVFDGQSKSPIAFANVLISDSSASTGVITDNSGNFRIEKVLPGRQVLEVSFIGYKKRTIPIIVTSGKEVVLNIELEESVNAMQDVIVVFKRDKSKAVNDLVTISGRTFSPDETMRYAGSIGDPSRMAANYAGVSTTNDSRNDIVIRGNSPMGLLWRLNGIDIPNPNHFGTLGSSGGPISILNNNILDNSNFLTGAFPAEYGNALSGVFDLNMRSGNNEKREYLAQIGFNGFEAGIEGPFSKRRNNASYLVNYRYSSLSLFNALGIDIGTGAAVPQYQDISFRNDISTKKSGKFSLIGMGGKSYIELIQSKQDSTKKKLYGNEGFDTYYGSAMGMIGLIHQFQFNETSYGKFSLSISSSGSSAKQDSISTSGNSTAFPWYRMKFGQKKTTMSYNYTKKFSPKINFKTGVFLDRLDYSLTDSLLQEIAFRTLRNTKGNTLLLKSYIHLKYKFNDQLVFNAGLHYQQFFLNSSKAFEPRIGWRWQFNKNQSLSIGTGLHSQLQPIYIYFNKSQLSDGKVAETNKNLGFSKSIHMVMGYEMAIGQDLRLRMESYYQSNYNIPVEKKPSWFSMANAGADFTTPSIDSLVNKGKGKNYGVEITVEKFYSNEYYIMTTASLFQSRYIGSDGIERNTAFNGNYTFNILAGKEFKLGEKSVLSIDYKLSMAGGRRFVPIDLETSKNRGEVVYMENMAYQNKYKDYFRSDIKIGYKRNSKNITQELSVDFQNFTNRQNIFQETYNPIKKDISTQYQLGLFILPTYRLYF
jgi:hypothetical protein